MSDTVDRYAFTKNLARENKFKHKRHIWRFKLQFCSLLEMGNQTSFTSSLSPRGFLEHVEHVLLTSPLHSLLKVLKGATSQPRSEKEACERSAFLSSRRMNQLDVLDNASDQFALDMIFQQSTEYRSNTTDASQLV